MIKKFSDNNYLIFVRRYAASKTLRTECSRIPGYRHRHYMLHTTPQYRRRNRRPKKPRELKCEPNEVSELLLRG